MKNLARYFMIPASEDETLGSKISSLDFFSELRTCDNIPPFDCDVKEKIIIEAEFRADNPTLDDLKKNKLVIMQTRIQPLDGLVIVTAGINLNSLIPQTFLNFNCIKFYVGYYPIQSGTLSGYVGIGNRLDHISKIQKLSEGIAEKIKATLQIYATPFNEIPLIK